jgi:ATP-dependent DNA helicase RecG
MRNTIELRDLLDALAAHTADELEAQDLDFKEWPRDGRQAIRMVVDAAVCMANGGGGSVVLGVRDGVRGRAGAILGVPDEADGNRLKR